MAHSRMKIRKGDTVMILAGKDKKKTGKITAVDYEKRKVEVGGLNTIIKHAKPSQVGQPGGIEKRSRMIDISNVGIVHPTKKGATSRVGFEKTGTGDKATKKAVLRQAGNKELK